MTWLHDVIRLKPNGVFATRERSCLSFMPENIPLQIQGTQHWGLQWSQASLRIKNSANAGPWQTLHDTWPHQLGNQFKPIGQLWSVRRGSTSSGNIPLCSNAYRWIELPKVIEPFRFCWNMLPTPVKTKQNTLLLVAKQRWGKGESNVIWPDLEMGLQCLLNNTSCQTQQMCVVFAYTSAYWAVRHSRSGHYQVQIPWVVSLWYLLFTNIQVKHISEDKKALLTSTRSTESNLRSLQGCTSPSQLCLELQFSCSLTWFTSLVPIFLPLLKDGVCLFFYNHLGY